MIHFPPAEIEIYSMRLKREHLARKKRLKSEVEDMQTLDLVQAVLNSEIAVEATAGHDQITIQRGIYAMERLIKEYGPEAYDALGISRSKDYVTKLSEQ